MAGAIIELGLQLVFAGVQLSAVAYEAHQKSKAKNKSKGSRSLHGSLSDLTPISPQPRAVLISCSAMTFGNECERLVNIAFQTGQNFKGMMSTCSEVSAYIRKELEKHYPDTQFHIVIGENKAFGFCIDDGEYFAEIEQERYRVLIFSSKRNAQTKADHHDANSQMSLIWK
uniref:Uncharacterized protein n=1 Tax=Philodina roseola TaxID=96448 RepID=B6S355_PHIRO|nr:hypothetical protein [Philodina roseola]